MRIPPPLLPGSEGVRHHGSVEIAAGDLAVDCVVIEGGLEDGVERGEDDAHTDDANDGDQQPDGGHGLTATGNGTDADQGERDDG